MDQSHTITKQRSKKKVVPAQLTIGIDLGDRWSHYCVLDQAGDRNEGHRRNSDPAPGRHDLPPGCACIAEAGGDNATKPDGQGTTSLPFVPYRFHLFFIFRFFI